MDTAKSFFRENPYAAAPSPERFVAIGSVEAARRRLMDSIDRRDGIGFVAGPPGTGKSLLCSLIESAYQDRFDVVLLSEARLCTRRALLQHLLHHLGLPFADRSEGELRLALIDRAASGGPDSREGLLIIVDEAQGLPGRLLEELRMMAGIVRGGKPRVQLILAGGPLLDDRLSHPKMEALSQRIGARCYLHPLGCQDTGTYIRDSIRRVGGNPATAIDDEAVQAVYFASGGIPRLINQTMSRAITLAEAEGASMLSGSIVERAWADLQQLPSPVVDTAHAAGHYRQAEARASVAPAAVVEFGSLNDAPLDDISIENILVDQESEDGDSLGTECRVYEVPLTEITLNSDPMADTVDYEPGDADSAAAPAEEELGFDENAACDPLQQLRTLDVVGLFGDGFDEEQWIPSCFPTTLSHLEAADAPVGDRSGEIDLNGLLFEAGDGHDSYHEEELSLHAEILSINNEAMRRPVDGGAIAAAGQEWIDDLAADQPTGGDITIRDDRDMLVIEDELDLDVSPSLLSPRPARVRCESDADARDILSRLREG